MSTLTLIAFETTMLVAAGAKAQQTGFDPFTSSWLNYGLLGALLLAIIVFKWVVPGWTLKAAEERIKTLERAVEERDTEIRRLRDLMEDRTIPLLERTTNIVERVSTQWMSQRDPPSGI